MSRQRKPFSTGRYLGEDANRIATEERRVEVPGQRGPIVMPFSFPGTLSTQESGRWYPLQGGRIIRAHASLNTAGSTSTVVTVKVDGVVVETITFTASDQLEDPGIDAIVGRGSYVTCEITTAGTSAAGLVVQIVLAP